uniref:Uncharacterized protein n=1 Tax=Anopheles arabiensis TaxID=7173 RepID=A0A182HMA8_ANOAR
MARHLMAVCVVCLLCADHLPCKQHFSDDGTEKLVPGPRGTLRNVRSLLDQQQYEPVVAAYDAVHRIVRRHAHHHHEEEEEDVHTEGVSEAPTEFDRLIKGKMELAMRKIFTEYGDPASMTMDVQGFERMVRQLGMIRLVQSGVAAPIDGSGSDATETTPQQVDSLKCISSNDFLRRVTPPKIRSQEWEDATKSDTSSNEAEKEGSNSQPTDSTSVDGGDSVNQKSGAKLILTNDKIQNTSISNSSANSDSSNNNTSNNSSSSTEDPLLVRVLVPEEKQMNASSDNSTTILPRVESSVMLGDRDLYSVCPMLLGHLLSTVPLERSGCFDEDSIPPLLVSSLLDQNDPHHHHHHHHHHGDGGSEAAVWIYSFLTILGVSLCGLLGVAVIPCMDKHFYHHVLQFLVALAIGTLCGDALLHLLPHAMLSSLGNAKAAHDAMMYKGLAAVLGIVFFYFMERFLTVIAEWCKTRQKKDKPPSRVRVMRDPESTSLHAASAGEKQCKHKYSSYPYCYDEIAMDTKDDHHEHNTGSGTNENHNSALAKCANHHHNGELNADHGSSEYAGLNNHHAHQHAAQEANDNNTVSTNLDEGSIESEQLNNHHQTGAAGGGAGGRHGSKSSEPASGKLRPENYTIILREHETKHHGHSHTHGHVHSPPGSLSAVAWMVVMGDGLHNFTDGMTIGAAFANNIAGGFSTAIAVFCHELPHELGDFAVLLKAGMSAREAVYYNLLSSLLSLLGMVLGIIVGHQPEASSWVFAVAAGMFLYIALVDMIPELTSSHGAEERCKTSEFVLQFLGLTLGFSIMMVIAILNRVPRPLSSKGYCLRPAPPPEKKWLYKQVLESVQSGISPQLNLANSTLGRAMSQAWVQLNVATQRAQLMANEYHLKQRLGYVMKQVACCVVAVKDFFAQKQYYQLDRIIDKGLLGLEETIRASRETQSLPEPAKPASGTGAKAAMKNCTMVMLKRGPCAGDSKDVKKSN